MAVIEYEPNGVMTDGLYCGNSDILFARLQNFLTGSTAFDVGARRVRAQILERQMKFSTVVKTNDE